MATIEYDDILLNIGSRLQNKAVDNAIGKLNDLKSALPSKADIDPAVNGIREFASAINSIDKDIIKSISSMKGSIGKLSSSISKISKKADFVPQSMQELEEISRRSLQRSFPEPMSDSDFDKMADQYRNTTWSGITDNGEADQLREAMGEVAGVTKDAADNASEFRKEIGKSGEEAKKSLSPIDKLINKFKNFLQYRAMRAIWSGMVNAMKEGLKNLEDWDRNIGHTGFADSMDRARSSLTALKNSLAVVSAPLIEYLINGLAKVAQWAMSVANAISRMIAILGGKTSYRAVVWADAVASSQASAAGSAKKATEEFKKQLMGFDEINNLTAQDPSGSSGGGGGGGVSAANEMFEERSVGELGDWGKFLQKIGEAWREMSEKIRTTDDATTRHLGNIKDVWQGWKDFFADPKASWDAWKQKADDAWQSVKNNFGTFGKAYKEAVAGGADPFEAVLVALEKVTEAEDDALQKAKRYAGDTGEEIQKNIVNNLKKATTEGDNSSNAIKKISDFAKKWLLPANIENGLTNPLINAKSKADNVGTALSNVFNPKYKLQVETESAQSAVQNAVDNAKRAIDSITSKPHLVTINVNQTTTERVNRYIYNYEMFTGKAGKFASGGYPTTGQMFIAREAGPELVGTIGGSTAVVNNQDIVASVSQGVASAVASVLGGGTNVSVTLEGDAKNLFKVVQREGRAYSARTGQPSMA